MNTQRWSRKAWRFSLLALLACTGCQPGYMKASELESRGQGPSACAKSCADIGMRMGALVLVSNDLPGCVCQPVTVQGAPPPPPASAPATAPAAPTPAPAPAPTNEPATPPATTPPATSSAGEGSSQGAAAATTSYVVLVAAAVARQSQIERKQQKQQLNY